MTGADLERELISELKGEYAAQLRGRHNKSFDNRGLHIVSYLYGRLAMFCEHEDYVLNSLQHYKDIALADARAEFLVAVREHGSSVFDHPNKAERKRG